MTTLYKYLPNLGINYFEQPTLKISPPLLLNDPFEFAISSEIKRVCRNYFKENSKAPPHLDEKVIQDYLRHNLSSIGIISLSETHRNLLMWAHYADEHKGFCIGIEDDYLNVSNTIEPNISAIPVQNHPIKIKYDTKRFDLEIHESSLNNLLNKLALSQLTVKSDDWIYEKEYRSIVYLLNHDKVIFNGSLPKEVHFAISYMKTIKLDTFDDEEADRSHSELNIAISLLARHKEVIFLKVIPTPKIKSIYLGHRFDKNDMKQLIKNVGNENHPLHNTKIYKYSIHPSRFELTPKLLHSN